MAFLQVRFWSESLQVQSEMHVILPDRRKFAPPYPTLYLLHGLSDDHSIWARRTSVERYVADLPLMVVMPSTGRFFYTDMADGYPYESHIVQDVVGFVDTYFPTVANRTGRCLTGNSMGGYGSIKIGLKYPDRFGSISAHSSAIVPWGRELTRDRTRENLRIFGESPEDGPNDIYALIQKGDAATRPALRFDCGTDDFLLEQNRAFHQFLEENNVTHVYEEYPGEHNWAYWDEHVQQSIAFHVQALSIQSD